MKKTIFILGGYGNAGLPIANLLLQETRVDLILAGRNKHKADKIVNDLNKKFPGNRVSWRPSDASAPETLISSLKGVDLFVACSPTTQYLEQIAKAVLLAKVDYLDIYFPQKAIKILKSLELPIKEAGCCFIAQAGFHPGLVAPFMRYPAAYFSRYKKATIGMLMNVSNIGSFDSASELIEEFSNYHPYIFKDKQWRSAGFQDFKKINFGPDLGTRLCSPIWFEEMFTMPAQLDLEEGGAYVAGLNWFVDYLVTPLAIMLGTIRRGLGVPFLTKFLLWGIKAFSKPPFGVVFKIEAEGEKDGKPKVVEITAKHDDAFVFTAIPAVACLLQYLDGSIARPGLWLMGEVVEPKRLIKDLERMGVKIQIQVKETA